MKFYIQIHSRMRYNNHKMIFSYEKSVKLNGWTLFIFLFDWFLLYRYFSIDTTLLSFRAFSFFSIFLLIPFLTRSIPNAILENWMEKRDKKRNINANYKQRIEIYIYIIQFIFHTASEWNQTFSLKSTHIIKWNEKYVNIRYMFISILWWTIIFHIFYCYYFLWRWQVTTLSQQILKFDL